jgi:metal-dependent amidase/aminoacylase/carboxypeptidase family protein
VTSAGLSAALHAALARELSGAVRLRHDLHSRAEPSGSEHRTSATVSAALARIKESGTGKAAE